MPIEITELVIKAQVGSSDTANSSHTAPPVSADPEALKAQQAALEKAVETTLDIINRKNER